MTIDHLVIDVRSVLTLLSLLTFVGIVVWAYSSRREQAFKQAANLPFADDDTGSEGRHG